MTPLVGANAESLLLDRIRDSPGPSLGSLGGEDPFEDRAPCGARERVPALANERVSVEGAAEIIRPFERTDALYFAPGPIEFGAAAAVSPARSPTTQPRSRALRRSRTRAQPEASSATTSPVDGHDAVPQDSRRQPPDRQLLDPSAEASKKTRASANADPRRRTSRDPLLARSVHPALADAAAPAANGRPLEHVANGSKRPMKGRPIAFHA